VLHFTYYVVVDTLWERVYGDLMNETCDKCGHRAYFKVIGKGGELYFCRHDFMDNEAELRFWADEIEDHSAILFEKTHPTAAPDPLISVADPGEADEEAVGV
jgi:hypothetical protein